MKIRSNELGVGIGYGHSFTDVPVIVVKVGVKYSIDAKVVVF